MKKCVAQKGLIRHRFIAATLLVGFRFRQNPRDFDDFLFFVGIANTVGISYAFPSSELAENRSTQKYVDSLHPLITLFGLSPKNSA
jgi:hypothetical protein